MPVDDLVKAACVRLKDAGSTIALDDFVTDDPRAGLVEFADIIKLDLKATSSAEQSALVKRYGSLPRRMLAKKVETRAEFNPGRKAGFSYFQGYFFRRPELLQAREIPKNQVNYLRLLQAISRDEIEASGRGQLASEIHSARHGLAVWGEREVRCWVRLVAVLGAGENEPSDLLLSALVRARYWILLGPTIPHGESDLFLVACSP